ncbi:protoheme IX farnesyltransferase [Candidatus Poribacteria bacterium]|nr:MAG: protoheme IX farnesyltransferase [Candidatus Poribacteria bacterium]
MRSTTITLPDETDTANQPSKHAVFAPSVADFIELVKPRLVVMILITTAAGFYLGAQQTVDWLRSLHTLVGAGLTAAGVLGLNQYLERDVDARMKRTQERPLPGGRMNPLTALLVGAVLTGGGMLYLTFIVNVLSGFVISLIVVSYLFLYTPLKRKTSLCTLIGAVPGALPPVVGWVAARGSLTGEAWVLFTILFLWQIPHSLAIAYIYREDYAKAGFRLLPVIHPDGTSTCRQIVVNCVALLGIGLLPTLYNIAGSVYFFTALLAGVGFLAIGIYLARTRSVKAARYLLYASLVYLPLVYITMALDKTF